MELHNFIRGNDKVPGAWAVIDNQVWQLHLLLSHFSDSEFVNSHRIAVHYSANDAAGMWSGKVKHLTMRSLLINISAKSYQNLFT